MALDPCLHPATLTGVVDETRNSLTFLRQLLFSDEVQLATDKVDVGIIRDSRTMAPMVQKGSRACEVTCLEEDGYEVEAPTIRMKKIEDICRLYGERAPGFPKHPTDGQIESMGQQRIARIAEALNKKADNREEWLIAQWLRDGQIEYNGGAGKDHFLIDFQRPAAFQIAAAPDFWDAVDGDPCRDLNTARDLLNEAGLGVTHVLLGSEAAQAFKRNQNVRDDLDNRSVSAGLMNLTMDFTAMGAQFLGSLYGVQFWSYGRQLEGTPLLDPKTAYFVDASPSAENVFYYARVHDARAWSEGQQRVARYMKSYWEEDPGNMIHFLMESRPLPVPRRVESVVAMGVVTP